MTLLAAQPWSFSSSRLTTSFLWGVHPSVSVPDLASAFSMRAACARIAMNRGYGRDLLDTAVEVCASSYQYCADVVLAEDRKIAYPSIRHENQ